MLLLREEMHADPRIREIHLVTAKPDGNPEGVKPTLLARVVPADGADEPEASDVPAGGSAAAGEAPAGEDPVAGGIQAASGSSSSGSSGAQNVQTAFDNDGDLPDAVLRKIAAWMKDQ